MERTIRQQAQELTQLHQTVGHLANLWEVLAAREEAQLVLATGAGNPPAVRVWTGNTVQFGSRTIQKPDPLLLGGPKPAPYPSTCGFGRGWRDLSGPISGLAFWVVIFMVSFRYPTVNRGILTMVR